MAPRVYTYIKEFNIKSDSIVSTAPEPWCFSPLEVGVLGDVLNSSIIQD